MNIFKYLNLSNRQPPTIYMNGNESIYLEHFEHLKHFESHRIALQLYTMDMIIEGKQLYIQYFSKHDIKINGQIEKIMYYKRGGINS